MRQGEKENSKITLSMAIAVIFGAFVVLTGCDSATTPATDANATTGSVFESDSIVNQLLVAYNENAEHLIKPANVEKGNINTKAIISLDGLYVVIVNSSTGFVHIRIEGKEPTEVVYDVFRDFLYAIDNSITTTGIEAAWADIHAESYSLNYPGAAYKEKSYELNDIQLCYSDIDLYGRQVTIEMLYMTK